MAGDVSVRVTGLDHLKRQLQALPKAMRKKVLRNALAAGARIVRDAAKSAAPVLTAQSARRAPYRQRGTLKKAIRVRTSKQDRRAGNVGVFVNVKPAKQGQGGAKSKTDPFYWRWQEFGWTPATGPRRSGAKTARRKLAVKRSAPAIPGRKFLSNAASKLPEALRVFETQLARWVTRVSTTGAVTE